MKILFSNAPWHQPLDEKNQNSGWVGVRAGSRWPHTMPYRGGSLLPDYLPFPFFLATAAALAKQHNLEAIARDSIAMGETYQEYYDFITTYAPAVIVMETSTPSLGNDLEIAAKLKQQFGQVIIIFTGIHFQLEQETFLSDNPVVDYAVYGEYETSVLHLLQHLTSTFAVPDLKDIGNLIYRENNRIIKNPAAKLVEINTLPWPQREDFPWENYIDTVCGLDRPQLQVLTTRGCPYGCIFCVWPQLVYQGRSYRMRSPKDVVDEIEANFNKHPYKSFYIDDDTFNISPKHVIGIARQLKKRDMQNISWGAMCRADLMNEEILTELRAAGLYSVKYGVESASQEVINDIDKKLDLEKVYQMVELTKSLGIKVHLTFTFGLPNDTRETINETIELACRLPNDSVQFSIATPFPGTAMYRLYDRKGWITTKDWKNYNGSAQAVSRTERFSGEQLQEFIEEAQHRYMGAKARTAINRPQFKKEFAERLKSAAPPGTHILVLQSAIYTLTQELLHLLKKMGYHTHLLLHKRFVPRFQSILPPENLHIFENTGDFRYRYLKETANEINEKYTFAGAIIPTSNASGAGYSEVEKIAREAAGNIIAKVTVDGKIIRNQG